MKTGTRATVESGVMIALATVLSFIKVYAAPQGGAVTAGSMIPIMLVALRWGPRTGILAGAVYGAVQLIVEPFVVHPVQLFLDYFVPFGLLGIAGFFPRKPALGAVMGVFGRFVSHVVSGTVFFAAYAPEGTPALLYSIVYNGSYLVLEAIVSAVVLSLLWSTTAALRARPESR